MDFPIHFRLKGFEADTPDAGGFNVPGIAKLIEFGMDCAHDSWIRVFDR